MSYGTIKVDTITFTDNSVDKSVSLSGLIQNPTFTGNITVTGTISGDVIRGGTTVSGATVTGTTANFVSGVFTTQISGVTVTGTTASFTSGVFTNISGTTATITSGIIASGTAAAPSLAILADLDTGLFSPGANQLAVATNGVGRLFVDASGNVGINTASTIAPGGFGYAREFALTGATSGDSSISVNLRGSRTVPGGFADINFWHQSTANRAYIQARRGSSDSAIDLDFITSGGAGMRITSAGLVGVGTSSPSANLTLKTSAGYSFQVENASQPVFQVYNDTTASTGGAQVIVRDVDGNTGILLDGRDNANSYFNTGGRLGIGTSAPGYLIHARISRTSGANATALVLSDDVTGAQTSLFGTRIEGHSNAGSAKSAIGFEAFGGTNNDTAISFYTQVSVAAGLTRQMIIDSLGRVGIGTTSPGEVLTVSKSQGSNAFPLHIENSVDFGWGVGLKLRQALASGGSIIDSGAILSDWESTDSSTLEFYNCTSGSLTEKARITSSGQLLVGTSTARTNVRFGGGGETPTTQLETAGNTYSNGLSVINNSNSNYPANLWIGATGGSAIGSNTIIGSQTLGNINFVGADGSNLIHGARIHADVDGTIGANDLPTRLVFSTTADGASSPTERMRISNGGQISQFSDTGWENIRASSASAAGTTRSFYIGYHSATGVNTGTLSYRVYTNGNVQNTNNSYGAISDIKLKENIVDANSQWDDLKALQVRNYNFKEGQTHTQIGLVAQEVELVSPGLVSESPDRDEEGNDLGTVTKSVNYSVLYMKAVKALQEAIAKIETLEGMVAVNNITIDEQQHQLSTLAARLTALESA
jgi:hypothetical protein